MEHRALASGPRPGVRAGKLIDPGSEVAPYLQLAGILRGQISSGELAPGAKLPSIIRLSEDYHVARVTAHKALKMLEDEGLTVVSPGRGTYVRR
jgi:DNA-binding GntR family transcriptional regulator